MNCHRGSWADTPGGAVTNALQEVNIDPFDFIELQYGNESLLFVPLDPDGKHEIYADVHYSEAREQFKAKLTRRPHIERD